MNDFDKNRKFQPDYAYPGQDGGNYHFSGGFIMFVIVVSLGFGAIVAIKNAVLSVSDSIQSFIQMVF